MKSKGFTLVELIAVIAILAILMLLATGIFINVQRNVLERQYNNIIIDIENKAEEYARDIGATDVIYINVDYLIENGYIQADDGNYIYDPRDNTIMNCYMIHVALENGEYKAEFLENENLLDEATGTCNEANINTGTLRLLCNGENCNDNWYNGDVTLSIGGLSEDILNNSTVEWTSLLGTYLYQDRKEDKTLLISPNTVLNTTYNVSIVTDDETFTISQNIKIDKELPVLVARHLDVNYSGLQNMSINASDMNGSGIGGYAITNGDCETADYKSSNNILIDQAGSLHICLKDNAGNVREEDIFINQVTFNYNNVSSTSIISVPVYFLEGDVNYPLLIPERDGYTFLVWQDAFGNRIYSFDQLKNGDVLNATWNVVDVSLPIGKIDKNSTELTNEDRVNIVLVLDDSGSMMGSRIADLKEVSTELVDNITFSIGSTISIIKFTSTAEILLVKGTSANEAKEILNQFEGYGGTSFSNALSKTHLLLTENNFDKDSTFVIFVSDGDGGNPDTYANAVKDLVNKVYSIGIGTNANTTYLTQIASPDSYFHSNEGLDSLSEIFNKIQDEILENVTVDSQNGLIELPNLYVTADYPFKLNINGVEYQFPSISSMSDILTGSYYLDLVKVDNKYKLNGNIESISFTYYYE